MANVLGNSAFIRGSGIDQSILDNYLPLSGGTITGDLYFNALVRMFGNDYAAVLMAYNHDKTKSRQLILYNEDYRGSLPNGLCLKVRDGDVQTEYKIFGEHNFNPAKYLLRTGGTLTGGLNINGNGEISVTKVASNGSSVFYKNNSETADYGTVIQDFDASGNTVFISVSANEEEPVKLSIQGGKSPYENGVYKIFGEHNIDALVASIGGKVVPFSYVGTGTYGSANPSSFTFEKEPIIAIILCTNSGYAADLYSPNGKTVMVGPALTTEYASGKGFDQGATTTSSYGKKSSDGKTFSWYNKKSADEQCNASGKTYYGIVVYE